MLICWLCLSTGSCKSLCPSVFFVFLSFSVCLSIYLFVFLYICRSVYLSFCRSFLSLCFYVNLSFCSFVYLSFYFSVFFVFLFLYLSVLLSFYPFFFLSVHLRQIPIVFLLLVVVVHLLHQVEPIQKLFLRPNELGSVFKVLHLDANLRNRKS